MQKWLLLTLFALLQSLLISCATVPDVPVCTEISPDRGWCTNTISDKEFYIDDQNPYSFDGKTKPMTWWEMRPIFVLVPPQSYAALKAYIVKTCKQQKCDDQVGSWERRIKRLDEKIEEKRLP